jgi:hypothetical protein
MSIQWAEVRPKIGSWEEVENKISVSSVHCQDVGCAFSGGNALLHVGSIEWFTNSTEKLIVAQLVKKPPSFTEFEVLSPCSQKIYPEPVEFIPRPHTICSDPV